MCRIGKFLEDRRGVASLGSIAIVIGFSICAMITLAISDGRLPGDPKTAAAPSTNGALQLTQAVALPVGSVVVHSDNTFTSFQLPDGGWLDAWSHDSDALPEGSILTSPQAFTVDDGRDLDAARFASSVTEAYSSQAKFAFK